MATEKIKAFSEIDTSKFFVLKPKADAKVKIITMMTRNESGRSVPILYQAPKMKIPFGIGNNANFVEEGGDSLKTKWHINASFQGEEIDSEIGEYKDWLEAAIHKGVELYFPHADTFTPRNSKKKHTMESLEEIVSPIIKHPDANKEGQSDTTKEAIPTDYETGLPSPSVEFYTYEKDENGKKKAVKKPYTILESHCECIRILQLVGFKINPTGKQIFPYVKVIQGLVFAPPPRVNVADQFRGCRIKDDEESEPEEAEEEYIEEEVEYEEEEEAEDDDE